MTRVRISEKKDVTAGMPEVEVEMMLDSGAFGAWTRGQDIDVQDYIAFVKEYGHLFDTIVNLDSIPGEFGVEKTPQHVEIAAEKSYENLQAMKEAGIKAIPVFHQGESWRHLERLVDDGEDYIGISPSGDSISMNSDWFDTVFRVITTADGSPVVKTHGFGVTSIPILRRYPWYSADSATWVIKSGYGCVFAPRQVPMSTDLNFSDDPISIWVTGAPRKNDRFEFELSETWIGDDAGKVISQHVTKFMEEYVGVNWFEMRYDPYIRMHAMARYFQLGAAYSDYSKYKRSGSFFETGSKKKPLTWKKKKLIFAVGPPTNVRRSHILNDLGIKERLLSYFDLRDAKPEDIHAYARHGAIKPIPRKRTRRYRKENFVSTEYWNWRRLSLARHTFPEAFEKSKLRTQ